MRTLAAIVRALLLVLSAAAFVAFWFGFQGYGFFAAPLGVLGVLLLCAFFLVIEQPSGCMLWANRQTYAAAQSQVEVYVHCGIRRL